MRCLAIGLQFVAIENLEIDHVDRENKEIEVTSILKGNRQRLAEELSKCQLLCFDCHKLKTIAESSVEHGEGLTGRRNCFCDLCRPKKYEYNLKYRPKAIKQPYVHGERRTYLHGCHCDLCKKANSEYCKNLRNAKPL